MLFRKELIEFFDFDFGHVFISDSRAGEVRDLAHFGDTENPA